MSQTALWAVMRAYNIPDVDLLEVIYGRTTACMDSDDAECAIITFLTGVIQGGASSPRIFIIFINALLEHLTSTGKALGISHGLVETEQFKPHVLSTQLMHNEDKMPVLEGSCGRGATSALSRRRHCLTHRTSAASGTRTCRRR